MEFDPRSISTPVYDHLTNLRNIYDNALKRNKISPDVFKNQLQEQKSEAVQLYSYISSWGLMRLKGEEIALNKWNKDDWISFNDAYDVLKSLSSETPQISGENEDEYYRKIKKKAKENQEGRRAVIECFFHCLQKVSKIEDLTGEDSIKTLKKLDHHKYMGLTGLSLKLAQEFSFWADAIYHDVKVGE